LKHPTRVTLCGTLLLAACEHWARPFPEPGAPTGQPFNAMFHAPHDAVPMKSGPYRGARLAINCRYVGDPATLNLGTGVPCFAVAWQLVLPDTAIETPTVPPSWHPTIIPPREYRLTSDDTSIVYPAGTPGGFRVIAPAGWIAARRLGKTTLRVSLYGAEAALPVTVRPLPISGWAWPVRDTVASVGQWVEVTPVLRDTTAGDAESWRAGFGYWPDSATSTVELRQDSTRRSVRVRLATPGCVALTVGSWAGKEMYVHFRAAGAEGLVAGWKPRPSMMRQGCTTPRSGDSPTSAGSSLASPAAGP
jgi:hypothetical protein